MEVEAEDGEKESKLLECRYGEASGRGRLVFERVRRGGDSGG